MKVAQSIVLVSTERDQSNTTNPRFVTSEQRMAKLLVLFGAHHTHVRCSSHKGGSIESVVHRTTKSETKQHVARCANKSGNTPYSYRVNFHVTQQPVIGTTASGQSSCFALPATQIQVSHPVHR